MTIAIKSVIINDDLVPSREKRKEKAMTDFCVCDIAKGEVVEVVASDSVTPRVQQLLQRHGRYYVFDGFDEAQGLVFLTSDYGHFVYLPISQVVLK